MQAADVQVVTTQGHVPEEVKDRARHRLAELEAYAPGGFLHAEVRFQRVTNEPATTSAHALLDVQGRLVQARMSADQPGECLDLLSDRLQRQLRRLNERLQSRRHEPEVTADGQWRHGALPTPRPDHFPRPESEREVVERVTHARRLASPEEAAFDLEILGDDWLLYVDEATTTDALIRRLAEPEAYAVSVVGGAARVHVDGPYELELEGAPPTLDVDTALRRLADGDEGHVFFVDADTDRGAVAYWRYDGHYGLVRPRRE